jgi:hypothetical protein
MRHAWWKSENGIQWSFNLSLKLKKMNLAPKESDRWLIQTHHEVPIFLVQFQTVFESRSADTQR